MIFIWFSFSLYYPQVTLLFDDFFSCLFFFFCFLVIFAEKAVLNLLFYYPGVYTVISMEGDV